MVLYRLSYEKGINIYIGKKLFKGGLIIARRYGPPLYGKKYCGNTNKMEVHDLDNEDTSPSGCQIDEIIDAGHARSFNPDTLEQAHREGYDDCAYCIGGSTR